MTAPYTIVMATDASPDEMNRWVEEAVTGSEIDCQEAAKVMVGVIVKLQEQRQHEYQRANRWELRALNAEADLDRLRGKLAALGFEATE